MSDRKNVVIEADDITIIQGEQVKDYNVRVIKEDGSPIANLPLVIAFYNKDYSFPQDVTTNDYGVASVPLYLTGDSWRVDVHFQGDDEYAPNLVTKTVHIQRFERLKTKIISKNLHINEDSVIETNNGWYSVWLKDSNNLPVQFEPITFSMFSSKEDVDIVTFTLNTDEEGKVIVPYLTHDDTVTIFSEYGGCTRFYPSEKEDVVSFDAITDRTEVTFGEFTEDGENYLQIKLGNGNWQEIAESGLIERCIINDPNDDRTSNDGIFYYTSMRPKTYQVTLFYKGNSNYFSKVETLSLTRLTDTRKIIDQWITEQGGYFSYEIIKYPFEQGGLIRNVLKFGCKLFNVPFYVSTSIDGESIGVSMPTFYVEDGVEKTMLDFTFKCPHNSTSMFLWLYMKTTDHIRDVPTNPYKAVVFGYSTNSGTATSRSESTLYATGFGAGENAYQSIDVYSQNNIAVSYDKINEYYIMQLVNEHTMESFYIYSYLADNVTPSHTDFLLGLGDWQMFIVSKETEDYDAGFYYENTTITENIPIIEVTDFFYDEDNYTNIDGNEFFISGDTITTGHTINYVISHNFTDANLYKLSFNSVIGFYGHTFFDGGFIIGADPNREYDPNMTMDNDPNKNGLYVDNTSLKHYKEGILINEVYLPVLPNGMNQGDVLVELDGEVCYLYLNGELLYSTDELLYNTLGFYNSGIVLSGVYLYTEPVPSITPAVDDYDGSVFGSNIHFEFRDDHLNMIDYGMLPQGATGGGNVIVNDVPLPTADLELELEVKYNNTRFDRLNNLTGQMQMRIYEDIITDDVAKEYSQVLCSPMVVPNVQTVFTRHSNEGILYYIKDPKMTSTSKESPYYLCNAYNQYKGGVSIYSETGVHLFDLDNAYSPVVVSNELVSAEFHRRSGYIKLSRYDENTGGWYVVNILKLNNNPQLVLNEYNDDFAQISFGKTTWKFYRGRPFIVCNHKNDDLRILNLVDRVYCETIANQRGLGFIDEYNPKEQNVYEDDDGKQIASYSVFDPQLSIQQFKQDLHIGQNIRADNFEVYEVLSNGYLGDVSQTARVETVPVDNDTALSLKKNDSSKVALNFPSYSSYVKRVNDTFSLLIDYIDSDFTSISVTARGFDERGAVPVYTGIQYGIWEQTKNVTLSTSQIDEIRLTFTDCPKTVQYIDFVITINDNTTGEIVLKDFMYYEGDSIISHQVDTSIAYAERVEIMFDETYFANLYNQNEGFGLCIMRPSQHKISLKSIYADSETVFAPYMKKCKQWDKPHQLFLEYLNSKRQIIDIDWEN